jgi:hypothetical protein
MFLSALADNWIDLFGETYVDLNFIGVLRNLGLPDSREDFLKFVKPTNL